MRRLLEWAQGSVPQTLTPRYEHDDKWIWTAEAELRATLRGCIAENAELRAEVERLHAKQAGHMQRMQSGNQG